MNNFIKSLFLFALFNYILIGAIVLAVKKPTVNINKITVLPIVTMSPKVTTNVVPTIDNRCLVTVDGVQYDVTSFKNQHSGGDVFSCGTDMSNIFHGQHSNRYLKQMQRYRI